MGTGPKLISSTSGRKTLRYRDKNFSIPLLSPEQIHKKILSLQDREKVLIFIPSPVILDNVHTILNQLPESAHILCVEADQELMALSLEQTSPSLLHERITYIRTESPEAALSVTEKIGLWKFRKCAVLTLNSAYSLYRDTYNSISDKLQKSIRGFWQNKMTLIHMGRMWNKNLFKNLAQLTNSLPITKLKIGKHPCITGAGESLEQSLSTIAKFRNQLFVICVDTALPVLREADVAPDLVIILETQSLNLGDFIGQEDRSIPIAYDLSSNPGIHSFFNGTKYYFLSNFAPCSLLVEVCKRFPEIQLIPSLGSVGVAAVYLASTLTYLPVFFTGLDFSYIPGKPHSRGAPSQIESLSRSTRLVPPGYFSGSIARSLKKVGDKHGNPHVTDSILLSYLQPLKDIIEGSSRFYDIGSTGLHTGARLVETEEEIETILHSIDLSGKHSDESNAEKTPATSSHLVSQFFKEKMEDLNEIMTIGKKIITGKDRTSDKDLLQHKLAQTDYIYSHFPESPPLPFHSIPFIKRIVVSAGYYFSVIENILKS